MSYEPEVSGVYPHATLAELEAMENIEEGHTGDLKIEYSGLTGFRVIERVWLERTGIADGEPCDNKVTVERLGENGWYTAEIWEAK